MKIIYCVTVSCGRNYASLNTIYDTPITPNTKTKYQIAKGYFLYPKQICVSLEKNITTIRFVKRFWFWQKKKFDKFVSTIENKPIAQL